MDVNTHLKKGFFWITLERFSAQAIQFVISIVIARILSPKDYGLVAMMSIFLGVSQVFVDSGFSDALIQKKNKSSADYNTAFFFNLIVGLIVFLVIFFTAPLIALFYEEPALVSVARVLGALPLITSLGIVLRAHMTVEFKFKQIALSGLFSVLISGAIGIWMAYNGMGFWSIVAQTLPCCVILCTI